MHVYSPGAGADNIRGKTFLININILAIWSFPASFPIKRHSNSFPHSKRTCDQIRSCRKGSQGQPKVTVYINFVELQSSMLHAKFQDNRVFGSGEDFDGFEHKQMWQPSWSCDLNHLYKLSFPLPNEAPHEICLSLTKRGQTTDDARAWAFYKLTM